MINDKRIGKRAVGNELQRWPETTIRGAVYAAPASVVGLGHGYIAVMDDYGNTPGEIANLRAIVRDAHKPKRKPTMKVDADEPKTDSETAQDD